MNINDYQKEFATAIKKIKRHPAFANVPIQLMVLDFTNAISGEAGELANIGKKIHRKHLGYRVEKYQDVTINNQLKEEFADVLSNCMEMAIAMGWSVEEILLAKLKDKQDNG